MRTCSAETSLISCILALALGAGDPCLAAEFTEVTQAERELSAVPGEPNAPAVVIFLRGEMSIMDPSRSQYSSILEVQARIKILSEQGLDYAEQEVFHGAGENRLRNLEARTVLPDGTIVPLGEDAVFRKQHSRSEKLYVTSLAFPRVEPGAILDYRYEVHFDSYFIGPWLFQSDIPTMHSEIVYHVPLTLDVQPWGRATFNREMKNDFKRTPRGATLKLWMDDLPAIPDEPFRYPDFDLSSVFNLTAVEDNEYQMKLFSDWPTTCSRFDEWYYRDARQKAKQAKTRAKELSAEAAGQRQAAEAIYRFVRDEIRTREVDGVHIDDESTVDLVLSKAEGDYAEKALLLQAMLGAAGIDSRLVWVRRRSSGIMDMKFVHPSWFDQVIVKADVGGEPLFLDPAERRAGFGQISPEYEGMPALVFDPKSPEPLTIPVAPFERNLRRAEIELVLAEDGRLAGQGTLILGGHHAFEHMNWKGDAAETRQAWQDWMTERYPGFDVKDLVVDEQREPARVSVTFGLVQREEEVLGDEASLTPSRPLGLRDQPFSLPVASRRTPVLLPFADRDEVRVKLGWPSGFDLDVLPEAGALQNGAGEFFARIEVDRSQRTLVFERRLDTLHREYATGKPYYELRELYGAAGKSDAQAVVLVRR